VGVASQREELRARFPGAPADLVNFFHFVAEEVSWNNSLLWPYCAMLCCDMICW
jgi:glutamate synthase domain-containing protein 2